MAGREDAEFLARQYADAANLGARAFLHERFGTNPRPWQRWVFDHVEAPAGARVLEVGCGPGNLWAANADRLPPGWSVTLTDASAGMLREAGSRLAGASGRFAFEVADAANLPFENGAFDAVLANHVLYHLPERAPALSEMARVLGAGGVLHAATNGRGSQKELGWMQRVLDPSRPDDRYFQDELSFSLENGEEQISPWFRDVSLLRYEDALVVTEARPLLEYLLSGGAADAAREREGRDELERRASRLEGLLEAALEGDGRILVTKETGMFVARR